MVSVELMTRQRKEYSQQGKVEKVSDPSRADLLQRISQQSIEDPEFRVRLLADPRGVIGEMIGVSIPETINVTVHEETLTDIHLVLENNSAALSEDDLELVSGGWNGGACGGCCGCC